MGEEPDFFNELGVTNPDDLSEERGQRYLKKCAEGGIKTYTERFREDDSRILEQSDPTIVKTLDGLVGKLPELGKEGNLDGVKEVLKEVLAFRKS